jgi:oxaloacetate decarboxylase gamma subunit
MQGDLFAQGLELMLFGMGTVVLFLALLVVITAAMSLLVERWFPEPQPTPTAAEALRRLRAGQAAAAAGAPSEAELVAVIGAAVHCHRARKR